MWGQVMPTWLIFVLLIGITFVGIVLMDYTTFEEEENK
jgi:heme/copper-type cytochrome/quinol oxidase subunit 3